MNLAIRSFSSFHQIQNKIFFKVTLYPKIFENYIFEKEPYFLIKAVGDSYIQRVS